MAFQLIEPLDDLVLLALHDYLSALRLFQYLFLRIWVCV
jgi:hypothetical protein